MEDFDNSHKHALPDVVIVKKGYPKVRRRQQKRIWKLKRLDMEHTDEKNIHQSKKKKNDGDDNEEKNDRDYKEFLDEIEEDPDMR